MIELDGLTKRYGARERPDVFGTQVPLASCRCFGRKRVKAVLELVGLHDVSRKRAGTFSLGMGQRLGIAGALLVDPGILMFDEPVNGLDPEGIVWIRNLLRWLASEGRTTCSRRATRS